MKTHWKSSSTILVAMMIALTGCLAPKSTNKKSTTTNNTTSSDNTGGSNVDTGDNSGGDGTGNEPGIPDAGQTQDYYSINDIVIHGKSNVLPNFSIPTNLWSSQRGVGSDDQHIFYTNSRFNIRVRAQAGQPAGAVVSAGAHEYESGRACIATSYTKLAVTICLRSQTGSCIYTHTFSDISIGQVSKTKNFSVPSSSDALVIDVLDVKYDWSCTNSNNDALYCPYNSVSRTKCAKIDIQFSTDTTKDLPGERY